MKKVEFTDDVRAFTTYSFKPQLQYRWTASTANMLGEHQKSFLQDLDGNRGDG